MLSLPRFGLAPGIARRGSSTATAGIARKYRRFPGLLLVPLASSAYWVVPFVFGARYQGAVPLLWVLTPGAVCLSCGQVVGDLLRGRNRPIVVAWAQGFAAVATVGLILALLPLIGVYGAAVASTVAYGIALTMMLRALRQTSERPEEARTRVAAHVSSWSRRSKSYEVAGTTTTTPLLRQLRALTSTRELQPPLSEVT